MIKQLSTWQGRVVIDDTNYDSIQDVPQTAITDGVVIRLTPRQVIQKVLDNVEHIITVKRYMTKPASPEFDFMEKWNNNVPMPMRTMVGTVEKETKGMVYMKLHGELLAERMFTCMCCGKKLTNPVSQYFGVGPECSGHGYKLPEGCTSIEDVREEVNKYKSVLLNTTWEGWIIKSAIKEDIIKQEDNI